MLRRGINGGFTLVELVVVIALIAIIAGVAVPQFGRMIDNNRVVSTTNSVVGMLSFSRSEAIRRGGRVTVTAANNTVVTTLTSDGTVIRQIEPAAGDITITDAAFMFRATGMTSSGADVTIEVCSGDAEGREITITRGGRVSSVIKACP